MQIKCLPRSVCLHSHQPAVSSITDLPPVPKSKETISPGATLLEGNPMEECASNFEDYSQLADYVKNLL